MNGYRKELEEIHKQLNKVEQKLCLIFLYFFAFSKFSTISI